VVALVLAAAWPFFEREPEEYDFTAQEVSKQSWILRFEKGSESSVTVLAGIAALALAAGIAGLVLAPVALV
jgi:hypothetical protein